MIPQYEIKPLSAWEDKGVSVLAGKGNTLFREDSGCVCGGIHVSESGNPVSSQHDPL